jgi:hypothetical protein
MAETLWPGRDPLGQKLKYDPQDPESRTLTVVGVVPNLLLEDVDDPHRPAVLVPLAQSPSRFVTIATHVRVSDPFIAPLVLGVLVWVGLYLRDLRVRALLPLRS